MQIIGPEIEPRLDWLALTDALAQGHELPRAEIADSFLYRGRDTLLTRSAWIDGLGLAVKPATIFPGNSDRGAPVVNGVVNLLDDATGQLRALVDFHLVTKWKTAGDSLLSARRLARPDARRVLVIGAGSVAESMVHAYRALIPDAQVCIWNRSPAGARRWRSGSRPMRCAIWNQRCATRKSSPPPPWPPSRCCVASGCRRAPMST